MHGKSKLFVFNSCSELRSFIYHRLANLMPEQYDVTEEKIFSRYYVEVPAAFLHLMQ